MDKLATLCINAAGTAVIGLILLILAYLVYVALPLGASVSVGKGMREAHLLGSGLVVPESAQRLWRLPEVLHHADRGSKYSVHRSGDRALVIQNGRAWLLQLDDRDLRSVDPTGASPGEARISHSLALDDEDPAALGFHHNGERGLFAYKGASGALYAVQFTNNPASPDTAGIEDAAVSQPTEKLLHHELRLAADSAFGAGSPEETDVFVDATRGVVISTRGDRFLRWVLPKPDVTERSLVSEGRLLPADDVPATPSMVAWGPGRESLIVVFPPDRLERFDVARPGLPALGDTLSLGVSLQGIYSESRRRVSLLHEASGRIQLLNPATGERLYRSSPDQLFPSGLQMSADGNQIFQLSDTPTETVLRRWSIQNAFPETTRQSLWLPVHYPAYDEPGYIWHPDGDSIGVSSKFGLTPLLFGTFKAAICGLLLAIPISVGAAIYTGYFLTRRRRDQVKPAIEMLEAFPTVVLGFLAGLWLAPLMLDHLALVFVLPVILIGVPLLLAVMHFLLQRVSPRFVTRPPRLLLLGVFYLLFFYLALANLSSLQAVFFGGSATNWLWDVFGLRYDQRNALLVGMAMGIAITPTMFSLIEDAIFAVPRGLSDGSLALGATRWQSLARVVLPAASPAILSGVVIGFARGLGETMIVLLAAGNTPVLQGDLFSGLRSLSASIAAELPEAAVSSVQFRVLFLAALVLFALTFVLNTLAELLRQRLRYAYANH